MQTRTEKQIKVVLELDEEEALWLKAIVQNPVHGERPEREPVENSTMRKRFWDAITDALGEQT